MEATEATEAPAPAPAPTSDIHVRSQFGKHVPRILRRQLILQLMQQYLLDEKASENSNGHVSTNECKATIQRFHGALLFVDISGFTALSLKLTPEDLKFHINQYFTKMLDIVDKHGGDVIKFAGDALFIIWETSHMFKKVETDESAAESLDFHQASKLAVSTAVECAVEICSTCGNHRVSLLPRNVEMIMKSGINLATKSEDSSGSIRSGSGDRKSSSEETIAFLNVHCGVTIGLMAGIDIGCNDRWEYFLMGEPLTSVAMAEAQASTGEIVISPEGHALLHPVVRPAFRHTMTRTRLKISESFLMNATNSLPSTSPLVSFTNDGADLHINVPKLEKDHDITLPCGCIKGTNGYCKIKRITTQSGTNMKRNKIKSKIDEVHVFDETNSEIESVFDNFMASRLYELSSIEDIQNEFCREISNAVSTNKMIKGTFQMKNVSTALIVVNKFAERVKLGFIRWAHSCLIDDIARHVHDVVRSTYKFEDANRVDVCRKEITKQLESIHNLQNELAAKEMFRESMMKARMKKLEQNVKIMEGTSNFLKRTMSSGGVNSLRKKAASQHNLLDHQSAGFSAEIRSVTVMFVKIDMPHMELLVEQHNFGDHIGQFGFLSKTVNESLADVLLLHRLQACIEALTVSFAKHGGQLRQFIVDDKGTVCIGTFGLRGAVSDDNAAAALETANMIVIKLQGLGLNCSIGVTMGKAFCGLVGSDNRHEYAVMGPSTNLSARLMCKAPPGGIICDLEIRDHDRTHQFITLADIVAKGYKNPVSTFKPIFKQDDADLTVTKTRLMTMLSYNMRRSTRKSGFISSDGSSLERQDSMSSNEDNINEEGANWVIAKMCKGPFLASVPADQKGPGEKGRRELIGRENEVRAVLTFLFSRLIDEEEEKARFRVDQSARFAGIMGPQGIGKSSVISAVVQQVTSVTVIEPSLKLHVFKSRVNGFQAGMPFNSFKPIFTEMFIRIFNISKSQNGRNRRRSAVLGNTASSTEIQAGVDFVMKLLPEKLRALEPLLGYLTFIPEQPEAIAALGMNSQDMVLSATELLFEIMQTYVKNTKNLVFLVIEDVHSFDLASLTLLRLIWTSAQGVIVLFTAEKVMARSSVTARPSRAYSNAKSPASTSSAYSNGSDDLSATNSPLTLDFAASLNEPDRYLNVELELFTEADTAAIVKSALSNCGVAGTDRVILERIFAESGGNPMYAYELAKLIAQQQDELIDPSMILLKLTHCHRLEEIICHRFDQLGTSAQTLLKLAAAICCFGSNFTLEVLLYVMSESDYDTSTTTTSVTKTESMLDHQRKILNDLFDIVNSESFVKAIPVQTPTDDEHVEITLDGILAHQYTFGFSIALEKTTIYDLLLSDQKQVIHERIAEYFQLLRKRNPQDVHNFAEESLHWQRASNFSFAMACSYQASLIETNEQKAAEHIDTAYRMYRAMRDQQEAGAFIDKVWTVDQMKKLYDHAMSKSKDIHSDTECCYLTLDDISQMFNCDSELLKISLYVEILMARKCALKTDQLKEQQLYLDEALQILLLTKNPFLLSSARVSELMHFLHCQPISQEMAEHEFYFCVGHDFEPICLKLFSAYIENYVQMVKEPELSGLLSKAQFVARRFHDLSKSAGGFHEIQCLGLELSLHCKVGNLKHASAIAQKITEVYDHEKHSADLISFYGHDTIPAVLAMIAQYLFLSSEWKTPYKYQLFAHQVVEKLTHVESIAAAIYFVTNNLVFLRRFDDALKMYLYYFEQLDKIKEVHTMTEGFYLEWLRRLRKYETFMKSGDANVFFDDVTVVDNMIQQGCVALNMQSTAGDISFDRLSVQGRGVDAVLAEICALRIIVLWNSAGGPKTDELRVYCRALGVYVRSTLSIKSGRPHELMFGKTNTLLVMLHLLQTVGNSNRSRLNSKLIERIPSRDSGDHIPGRVSSRDADPNTTETEKKKLFEILANSLSSQHIQHLRKECHPQYSIFTLLSVNLMNKLLLEVSSTTYSLQPEADTELDKIDEADETEGESADDMLKEGDYFHQFLINGSTEMKLKVCDWSKMSQLASPVHVAQMANR